MLRAFKTAALAAVVLSVSTVDLDAQYSVDLQKTNKVPCYCQEDPSWCGAAVAQMILEGYPGVKNACAQSDVWKAIQKCKDDAPVDWSTDPAALKGALMSLGGKAGAKWKILANPDASSLMYDVTFSMANDGYPTAVLVYGSAHWVMIEGFSTDLDPNKSKVVTLQDVDIVDPIHPPCVEATVLGPAWYARYLYATVSIPMSKWNGSYVAVADPQPPGAGGGGRAIAPNEPRGGEVIKPQQAIDTVVGGLDGLIANRDRYARLRGLKPLGAMLVNAKSDPYYLVPLGREKNQASQGAVIVNAYSPEIEEVGVFAQPVPYVTKDLALSLASKKLDRSDGLKADLVFEPSKEPQSRFMPLWRITSENRTNPKDIVKKLVYVNQNAKVLRELSSTRPGT